MSDAWDQALQGFEAALGIGKPQDAITVTEMCLRAVVVFVIGLAIIRAGDRRFLAQLTPFDTLLGLLLGSMLSRAINGSAPFVPTLIASIATVALHRVLSVAVHRFHWLSVLVKGQPVILARDARPIPDRMRRHHVTRGDLDEVLRLAGYKDLAFVDEARLERNGEISVVTNERVRRHT